MYNLRLLNWRTSSDFDFIKGISRTAIITFPEQVKEDSKVAAAETRWFETQHTDLYQQRTQKLLSSL